MGYFRSPVSIVMVRVQYTRTTCKLGVVPSRQKDRNSELLGMSAGSSGFPVRTPWPYRT